MTRASTPLELFCSYAHEDERWLQKLETHLSLLKRQGIISLWHDRLIAPGADWAKTIDVHLETASVILLLVSADFLASDYCYSIEMQRALERHAAGEARVVPILVRQVDWKEAPFAHLQALPTDAKPLASWRDEDRALTDVAAGIRRVIEDMPLLAASAPRANLPAIWNVPYQRNPFFLGRDDELAQLRLHLQAGQATALAQPQAISGLGGIGKSQLALEYAYQHHQDYQAVLWVRAESTEALLSSYSAVASLLRLPERETKEQEIIVQAVKTWLQTHRSWLLILDNADELALLPDFLPPSLGGHLLLTTRAAATGRLAHRLEIATLLPEQGALFLLRRAALIAPDATLEQASQEERELALQISQELGGLPLALDQAGAYLEETGTDLAGYWHLYQRHRADLLQRRGGLERDHPAPVTTTWSLSFQQIEQQSPAAADLLRMLAFLAPDAIPEEILTADASVLGPVLAPIAASAFQLNQVFEALRAYSLIRRNPTERTLSIHRLVQAVLLDEMGAAATHQWMERIIRIIVVALPPVTFVQWSSWERLIAQALVCAELILRNHLLLPEAALLLQRTGWYLADRGRYREAGPLLERALQISEQEDGKEHLTTARDALTLANLYENQSKYEQAELLFQRALAIREQQLGPEHPDTAVSLNNLANLYEKQSKYEQAEPLYQRALAIREQQLGPEHPDTAVSLNNLAALYRRQGNYEQAESLLQRALVIWEQQLGPEHPDTATGFNNLALLYERQKKYAQAEPLYQRALTVYEQQLGPEHPYTAATLNNLAGLYRGQGKHAQAEQFYRRTLTIREQALGAQHPKTTETRTRLSALLHALGRHEEAARLEAAQAEL